MKERPIICRDDEVRAFIEGRKTQLRRPVKPIFSDAFPGTPLFKIDGGLHVPLDDKARRSVQVIKWCPFGGEGQRLWVRECFSPNHGPESTSPEHCIYRADDNRSIEDLSEVRWTPSSQMPRWASRITLEITNVRVERLQDITRDGALAEGVPEYGTVSPYEMLGDPNPGREECSAFALLWDGLYGGIDERKLPRWSGWDQNPFVWVVTVKPEVNHGR